MSAVNALAMRVSATMYGDTDAASSREARNVGKVSAASAIMSRNMSVNAGSNWVPRIFLM